MTTLVSEFVGTAAIVSVVSHMLLNKYSPAWVALNTSGLYVVMDKLLGAHMNPLFSILSHFVVQSIPMLEMLGRIAAQLCALTAVILLRQ